MLDRSISFVTIVVLCEHNGVCVGKHTFGCRQQSLSDFWINIVTDTTNEKDIFEGEISKRDLISYDMTNFNSIGGSLKTLCEKVDGIVKYVVAFYKKHSFDISMATSTVVFLVKPIAGWIKIAECAYNETFNTSLDILTNDVSAVKNLASQHPVIAQCVTTALSIASNIAVGKYTQSMPVALAQSALSFCTGIFSSKFETSIFSEVKKLIGYGKQDAPSEQTVSQVSGEHEKVE